MRVITLSFTALLLAATPLAAQDIFRPLQDFVEDLVPPRTQTRPAPSRPVEPVTPTPADERPDAEAAEDTAPEDAEVEPEISETDPEVVEGEEPPLPRPRPEEAEPELEAPPAEAVEDREPVDEPEPAPEETASGPDAEPDRIYQTACPALLSGQVVGEMLPPIAEGICGERSPLSITALNINGHQIALSSPVTTNCAMAGALADWVGDVDAYANAALDTQIESVATGTSMMCRNRNGGDEGFVSEHGFANALDVVGFTLADGRTIAVEADWLPAAAPEGKLLRQAHGAACGLFTTVLGPEANAEHEDHLHVDLGCHGETCTAQLCE